MIAHGARIYTTGHVIDCPYFRGFGRCVHIADRAVLFANVSVMPGVTIGEGRCRSSTRCGYSRRCPPYTVVGGNPARELRGRATDLRYRLDYSDYFTL